MEAAQKLSLPKGVSNVGNLMSIREENPKESEEVVEIHTSETSIHDNTWEEARPDGLLNENLAVIKPIMIGDPTQDILDLFLGHLLKRPHEEEQKMDQSGGSERRACCSSDGCFPIHEEKEQSEG
ncbi:hypothetical protein LIER_41308 [Lithospermum erythrorhizon]|uniref:Uncharacterized protein n=1 Tax=Lithospermum erythrorhizon TaxID=34254 RepID=A0AAV3RAU9_LITER